MTADSIFARLTSLLDRSRIPYMLTGSFASSYHGAPRATQDIDVVVAPTPDQLQTLARLLPDTQYYFDLPSALQALYDQTQFNVVDLATGWKIDLIIKKARSFSQTEFERRHRVEFQGLLLFVVSAEDVFVAKLEWAKRAQSQRQIDDVVGVLQLRSSELDHSYIARWVRDLGLVEEWATVCRLAPVSRGEQEGNPDAGPKERTHRPPS